MQIDFIQLTALQIYKIVSIIEIRFRRYSFIYLKFKISLMKPPSVRDKHYDPSPFEVRYFFEKREVLRATNGNPTRMQCNKGSTFPSRIDNTLSNQYFLFLL